MKTRIFAILAVALLLATPAVAQKVNVDWDRGTDFL